MVAHLILHGYSSERWVAHNDRDLIITCSRLLLRRPEGAYTLTWIKAHRSLVSAANNHALRLIHHNGAADAAAKTPLQCIPMAT